MDRIALKKRSKEIISKDFWPIIGIVFVVNIVTYLVSVIGSYTLFGTFFLSNILMVGTWHLYMNMSYNKEYKISDVFMGFKNGRFMTIFSKMAIYTIFMMLWMMFGILTLGIGLIWAIPKTIGYSMVPYLLLKEDTSNMTTIDVIEKSAQIMNGHKTEFFMLNLSFIGWIILSIITCGLVGLYSSPYINITIIYYFDEICEIKGIMFLPNN